MSFQVDFPAEYASNVSGEISQLMPIVITSSTPSNTALNTKFTLLSLPPTLTSVTADRIVIGWSAGDTTVYLSVSEPTVTQTTFEGDLIRTYTGSGVSFYSPAVKQSRVGSNIVYELEDTGSGKQVVIPYRSGTKIVFSQAVTAGTYTRGLKGFEAVVSGV